MEKETVEPGEIIEVITEDGKVVEEEFGGHTTHEASDRESSIEGQLCKEDFDQDNGVCYPEFIYTSSVPEKVALDVEFIGVIVNGEEKRYAARVVILNYDKKVIYNKFIRCDPDLRYDYHTEQNGITKKDVESGEHFRVVKREIQLIIENRIVIGHRLHTDFKLLEIKHPRHLQRDTYTYRGFQKKLKIKTNDPSLHQLCADVLRHHVKEKIYDALRDTKLVIELYKYAEKDIDRVQGRK
uniref:Exonuclease domain-containing protein n=1 Tax=Rhabditophanes sp. KR3021 TaxID=114890 RepID=A0AC35TKU0_9BILA